jgi:hypothetical protein
MRWCLAPLLAMIPLPALAQEQPLSGDAFEDFVEGRTMNTYNDTGLFGVETFLPGRRTIWRDAEICLHGIWREQDGMICYEYENGAGPFCSSFYDRGGWLLGFGDGIWGNDSILLYPSSETVTCEDFLGT